jgi:hypothetical protein
MKSVVKALIPLVGLLLLAGCDSRLEQTDGGGVLLSVSDFDGLPTQVSVNAQRVLGVPVTLDSVTIQSIVRDINGETSDLMNVEMKSYEVVYTRGDGGTSVPPPLARAIFGSVEAGGTIDYENLPILTQAQLIDRPLSDLFLENGGFDRETGNTQTVLNLSMRFFGRSLGGEAVDTGPVSFTVNFIP